MSTQRDSRKGIITLRVSESEKAAIETNAAAASMSVSDYARSLMLAPQRTPQSVRVATMSLEKRLAGVEDAVARARAVLGNQPEE